MTPEEINACKPGDMATELKQYVDAVLEKYRPVVNQTPELLSILYDVDLLPEQLLHVLEHNPPAAGPNASRMAMICELYARAQRLKENP